MSPLASALLIICEEEGNTSTVETWRNKALEQIASGERAFMTSSSVNGRSVSFGRSVTPKEMFTEASVAIRIFNRGQVKVTQVDFSNI